MSIRINFDKLGKILGDFWRPLGDLFYKKNIGSVSGPFLTSPLAPRGELHPLG
jgi:hypothetical protein